MKSSVSVPMFLSVLLAFAACGGGEQVAAREAELVVEPRRLEFGAVFVDEALQLSFEIRNRSAFAVQIGVEVPAPFEVVPRVLELAPEGVGSVDVVFAPTERGEFEELVTILSQGVEHEVEVVGIGTTAEVETVPRLDFGVVGLGQTATLPLAVRNLAHAPLFLEATIEGAVAALFSAPQTVRIEPLEETSIEVSYTPQAPLANQARLLLRACADCEPHEVLLVGEGARDALFLDPLSIDFGSVEVGTKGSRILWIRNDGSFDLKFLGADIVGGDAVPFEAALPAVGEVLAARGGSVRLDLEFQPPRPGAWESTLRVQVGSSVLFVPITGFAPETWIVAEPSPLVLGAVGPGEEARGTLHLSSEAKEDLVIVDLVLEGDPGFELTHPALPIEFAAPVDLQLRFRGETLGPHTTSVVATTNKVGAPLRFPVQAMVVTDETCMLAGPVEVRFGAVAPGTLAERKVSLHNVGAGVCSIWNARVTDDAHGSFSIEAVGAPELIAPGGRFDAVARFAPNAQRLDVETARLVFDSSGSSGKVAVQLAGLAADTGVEVVPEALDFGAVPVGGRVLRSLDIRAARDLVPALRKVVAPAPFAWLDSGETEGFPGAGSTQTLAFAFAPVAAGRADAVAELHFDHLAAPLLVPLTGTGENVPCVGSCLAPQATCAATIEAPTQSLVRIDGRAFAPAGLDSCTWSVVRAPPGSASTPAASGTCDASFRPDVVGSYELELLVEDEDGAQATCTTQLNATAVPAIHVEVSWSGVDDLDLHLLHENAGSPANASNWFDPQWDCFFSNPAPSWGTEKVLHLGDLRTGKGPEQLIVEAPIPGVDYVLGVHWFEGANGNLAQVISTRIHCDGVLIEERVDTLEHPMQAVAIGSVRFDGAGNCAFTQDGRRVTLSP